jgi:hypothetical protein
MPTECITQSLDFDTVEGRCVEAAFDGGLVTSDAGARLLGGTDQAIRMMDRFALWFHDERRCDAANKSRDPGRSTGVQDCAWLRGSQRPRRAATRSDNGDIEAMTALGQRPPSGNQGPVSASPQLPDITAENSGG